jgi:hypothetical protein
MSPARRGHHRIAYSTAAVAVLLCRMGAQTARSSPRETPFTQVLAPERIPTVPPSQGVVLPNTLRERCIRRGRG